MNLGDFVKSNAPAILTSLGVTGLIGTAVLAVKAGKDAQQHLSEQPAGLSWKEEIAETWRFYIPVAITGGVAIACIVGAQSLNKKRQLALIGLYTISEGALAEYKDSALEVLGPKKESEVRERVAKKAVEGNNPSKEFLLANPNEQLFLETMTGRYFNSSVESLRQAQNDINEMIVNSDYALLNDWYERIGLDRVQIGDETGFNHRNKVELQFSAIPFEQEGEATKPIMVVSYRFNPVPQPYNAF